MNTLPPSIKEALEFYAGDHEWWITFEPKQRAKDEEFLKNSPDWEYSKEDRRGHEIYTVTSAKAEKALQDLLEWEEMQTESDK